MVLFIVLYKVVLSLDCVDEVLKCNHLNIATEQLFGSVLLVFFSISCKMKFGFYFFTF